MAKKFFQKALSVGLSLTLCASMVLPSFAASFANLQAAIDGTSDTAENQFTADDGTTRYGYGGKNEETGKYDIEAWGDKKTTGRNIELNEDVNCEQGDPRSIRMYGGVKVTIELNGHAIDKNPEAVFDADTGKFYQAEKDENGTVIKDENGDKKATDVVAEKVNEGPVLALGSRGTVVTINDSSTKRYNELDENGDPILVENGEHYVAGSGTGQITGGNALGTQYGGGIILSQAGQFTMNGGKITGNWISNEPHADGHGGGLAVLFGAEATLNGVEVSNNGSRCHGGGLYVYNGSATGDGWFKTYNKDTKLTLQDCLIAENNAGDRGSALNTSRDHASTNIQRKSNRIFDYLFISS